jgi:hypothetical protein
LPTDAKQLVEIAADNLGSVAKITSKCLPQLLRMLAPELVCRRVDNDLDWLIAREFARPADDVFLGALVEIPLAKGKWIERVEELRYSIDPYLDSILLGHRNETCCCYLPLAGGLLICCRRSRMASSSAPNPVQSPDFKRSIA